MHGPTCAFWANLTPFSLQPADRISAKEALACLVAMRDPANASEPEPELEQMPFEEVGRKFAVKPMAERTHEIVLSHCQTSGQDQTSKINSLLEARGVRTWYDMQAQDLTAAGMEGGVCDSRCFLICPGPPGATKRP